MIPCVWTSHAAKALEPALDGASLEFFERGVRDGTYELWFANGCFVLTEDTGCYMRIWLVGGKCFKDSAHAISDLVTSRGYRYALFRSRHPAVLRLYRFMNAALINPAMHEYRVEPLH